jgi:hypothetical protein
VLRGAQAGQGHQRHLPHRRPRRAHAAQPLRLRCAPAAPGRCQCPGPQVTSRTTPRGLQQAGLRTAQPGALSSRTKLEVCCTSIDARVLITACLGGACPGCWCPLPGGGHEEVTRSCFAVVPSSGGGTTGFWATSAHTMCSAKYTTSVLEREYMQPARFAHGLLLYRQYRGVMLSSSTAGVSLLCLALVVGMVRKEGTPSFGCRHVQACVPLESRAFSRL